MDGHRSCTGCQPDWRAMLEDAEAHARALQQRIDGAVPYLQAIQDKPSTDGDAARWAAMAESLLAPPPSAPSEPQP